MFFGKPNMHLSGSLAFPQVTVHNCGSRADSGHVPTTQIYFRDIIQSTKTSWLYQPERCHDKKLKRSSLGLNSLAESLDMVDVPID